MDLPAPNSELRNPRTPSCEEAAEGHELESHDPSLGETINMVPACLPQFKKREEEVHDVERVHFHSTLTSPRILPVILTHTPLGFMQR